jgi:hypothetical protein
MSLICTRSCEKIEKTAATLCNTRNCEKDHVVAVVVAIVSVVDIAVDNG